MDQLTQSNVNAPGQPVNVVGQPLRFRGKKKLATKFLLAEYETIRSFKEQSEISTDRRLDVLLSLVTILGAALGFLSQQIPRSDFLVVALLTLSSLIIISIYTFRQVINRDILTADYSRALNRIRHFFAVENPDTLFIGRYILMNTGFDVPRYGQHSKSRETVVIIISLLFAALVEIARFLLFPSTSLDALLTLTVTLDAFEVGYIGLTLFAYNYYWRKQNETIKKIRQRNESIKPGKANQQDEQHGRPEIEIIDLLPPLGTYTYGSTLKDELKWLTIITLLTIGLTTIVLVIEGVIII